MNKTAAILMLMAGLWGGQGLSRAQAAPPPPEAATPTAAVPQDTAPQAPSAPQPPPPPEPPPGHNQDAAALLRGDAIDAAILDSSHARLAFQWLERYIALAGKIEGQPGLAAVQVSDLVGAKVTLRWLGLTVGEGEALVHPADSRRGSAVDLLGLCRQAGDAALEQLAQRLKNQQAQAAKPAATQAGAMTVEDLAASVLVDLQLARTPEDLILPLDAAEDELYRRFAPGYHGLILSLSASARAGNAAPAPAAGDAAAAAATQPADPAAVWTWPASALAGNVAPRSQLVHMIDRLGGPVNDISKLGKPGPYRLQRFGVLHVVRPDRDLPVVQLVRGNVLLPATSPAASTLEPMAQRLMQALTLRIREDGTLAGPYQPTANRYEPDTATPTEAALACYALAQRANFWGRIDPDSPRSDQTVESIRRPVKRLTQALTGVHADPAGCALLLLTLCQTPQFADQKEPRDLMGKQLLARQASNGLFRGGSEPNGELLAPPVQALVLLSLISLHEQTRDLGLLAAVQKARLALWTQPQALRSELPWIAQAEFAYSRLVPVANATDQKQRDVHARLLGKLVDDLLAMQITSPPAAEDGPADVVGGFAYRLPTGEITAEPDWRTANELTFLAAGLQQESLTLGRDKLKWLLGCGLGARFLAQLMFDEPGCFYVRSAPEAVGAVRLSLWDNRITLAATASSLLAVTQLQQTIWGLNPDRALWQAAPAR